MRYIGNFNKIMGRNLGLLKVITSEDREQSGEVRVRWENGEGNEESPKPAVHMPFLCSVLRGWSPKLASVSIHIRRQEWKQIQVGPKVLLWLRRNKKAKNNVLSG